MARFRTNRFQDFFEDKKYVSLKNYLYNYLLRKGAIEKQLRNERYGTMLEIGSGISPVVTSKSNVIYSDVSLLALKTLKNTYGKGLCVVADSTQLPFKNKSFSCVICSEVLEHIENDRKALQEIARVIKPSGSFIITFPHRHFYFASDDRFVEHLRRYELSEMKDLLNGVELKPMLVQKVLGPIEKITMVMTIFCIKVLQGLQLKKINPCNQSSVSGVLSTLFKWFNRFYAVIVWLDANIMPLKLSTVLLIKAEKR